MAESLIPVAFHGVTLLAVLVNGVPHVSIRSICEALGLDVEGQRLRIKRHPVLNSVACVTKATAADGKKYETLCLPLDKLNGWLFGVSAARVNLEVRDRLVQYQRECFDVLAAHFSATKPVVQLPAQPPRVRRWLVATQDGDRPSFVELPDDVQIGDWSQLAAQLRAHPLDEMDPHRVALAEAAARVLWGSAIADNSGHGQRLARSIQDAGNELSVADLYAISVAATGALWAQTAQEKRGANAKAARVALAVKGKA